MLALYGMSRKRSKFGNVIHRHLSRHGYTIYPIHPEAETVQGTRAFKELGALPQPIGGVIINLPPQRAVEAIREIAAMGAPQVFLQQGSESEEVLALCKQLGVRTYYKSCAILNSRPTGLHALHAIFAGFFGGGAREL